MQAIIDDVNKLLEWGGTKRDVAFLAVSAAFLAWSLAAPQLVPNPAWAAIVLCGLPIILEAAVAVITEHDITADLLVSLALIASVCIGEYFAAGEVAVIMQLGGLLEELTVARARAGIEGLVSLKPTMARVVATDGTTRMVAAEEVAVNDVIRVLPGETVPADGVITSGETSIDQSVMTGESMPVDKGVGDEVRSGTQNRFGAFELRATRVGEDSSIARMVALVQSADANKAKVVNLADKWAVWIVVIALVAAALTWLVTGQVIRAVTILVVFCPCALVLATPTAIMAAIGNVTKFGVLVREGDALERLAQVRRVMFDKTGTLTHGQPRVVAVQVLPDAEVAGSGALPGGPMSTDELYRLVAGAESMSEHPLGRAVVASWRESVQARVAGTSLASARPVPPEAEGFSMELGRGVSARVEGREVLVGTVQLMAGHGVAVDDPELGASFARQGCTVSLVAIDGALAGYVALADTVREGAGETIREIQELGVTPTLLTGDHASAARAIAGEVGVEDVHPECLPEDKLATIEACEEGGERCAMVGDGINDAPALRRAFVGIAMGGAGSDIAVDAADIALVRDDVSALPHVLALSRRMMTTIKLNMTFSLTLNFVAIVLAMLGVLDPVVGALVHNAGSVLVITNSALLLRWGCSEKTHEEGVHAEKAPEAAVC